MADRLPDGLYFRIGETAPDFFSLVTFDFLPAATTATAAAALESVWAVPGKVQQGIVRDLEATRPGDPVIRVDAGDLRFVLCFGPKLFDAAGRDAPLVVSEQRPDRLPLLSSNPAGPFPKLKWHPNGQPAAAQTDFAIQLTGATELAVRRPIVAGTVTGEHCLDEEPVVPCRHSDMALASGKQIPNMLPLIVTKAVASHRSAPDSLTTYEPSFGPATESPK